MPALVDILAALCREMVRTGVDVIDVKDGNNEWIGGLVAEVRELVGMVKNAADRLTDPDDDDEDDKAPESD